MGTGRRDRVRARARIASTTWHVLALAHRAPARKPAPRRALSARCATYVDPIVPKTLVIGDVVRMPIQLVNTTTAAVSAPLTVVARGATVTGADGSHTIPPQSSVVVFATLRADHAGPVELEVTLAGADAVRRIDLRRCRQGDRS